MIPFGLDWIAIGLALIALLRIGGGHRDGFLAFIFSNLTGILTAFMIGNLAIAVGNSIFLIANLRGYLKWKHQQAPTPQPV